MGRSNIGGVNLKLMPPTAKVVIVTKNYDPPYIHRLCFRDKDAPLSKQNGEVQGMQWQHIVRYGGNHPKRYYYRRKKNVPAA